MIKGKKFFLRQLWKYNFSRKYHNYFGRLCVRHLYHCCVWKIFNLKEKDKLYSRCCANFCLIGKNQFSWKAFNDAVAQGSAYQCLCPIHRQSDFSKVGMASWHHFRALWLIPVCSQAWLALSKWNSYVEKCDCDSSEEFAYFPNNSRSKVYFINNFSKVKQLSQTLCSGKWTKEQTSPFFPFQGMY